MFLENLNFQIHIFRPKTPKSRPEISKTTRKPKTVKIQKVTNFLDLLFSLKSARDEIPTAHRVRRNLNHI